MAKVRNQQTFTKTNFAPKGGLWKRNKGLLPKFQKSGGASEQAVVSDRIDNQSIKVPDDCFARHLLVFIS
ncbi:MAG: hypothetical protein ACOYVG_03100 [Bacteroidota bacterium]